jgi:hypothetical protein
MENAAAKDGPIPQQEGESYLVPDTTDRTSCLALLPANRFWSGVLTGQAEALRLRPGQLGQWLQAEIGPCAFYAMYGTPGRPVRSWLAARNWDLALYLGTNGVGGERFSSADLMGEPRYSWYWDAIYMRSPSTVACFAGRTSGCRAAVLAGADAEDSRTVPVPQVIRPERRWWRTETLVPGERFLGDVAREVGRERFQTFWISSLPVDAALPAALKQPIGTWTRQWQRRYVAPIRLGATAPAGAAALALILAAVAVSAVALAASRRQVR